MGQNAETVAIYWDFENLHAGLLDQSQGAGTYAASRFRPQDEIVDISAIIEFALSVGPIAINRAFANWVSFNRYRIQLLQSAIELIQVFPPGANAKNGADIKLCLDVMDDMVRFPHIRTIIVVGGDSDYMPLSYKVKAAGRTLIGVGSRGSTNRHWALSCHEFKFYETLLDSVPVPEPVAAPPAAGPASAPGAGVTVAPLAAPETADPAKRPVESSGGTEASWVPEKTDELRELLVMAVDADARERAGRELVTKALLRLSQARGETWIQKARLRPYIQRMDPTFDESSFGFRSFNDMITSMGDLVETRRGEFDHEIRLRPAPQGS